MVGIMDSASDRLMRIQETIAQAARRSGRSAADVTLLAVTKTVPLERVIPFLEAGIHQVGENRVQEAMQKYLVDRAPWTVQPTFHLIGQLQSNKAKKAVSFFDVIQSLDRLNLAKDIDRHAQEAGKTQNCLIEIKISSEESKSGLDPDTLGEFLAEAKGLQNLVIAGLMGIPPASAEGERARPYFRRLRKLFEESLPCFRSTVCGAPVLSMGMSSDYEVAIEEGSTMIRLGTALFGQR